MSMNLGYLIGNGHLRPNRVSRIPTVRDPDHGSVGFHPLLYLGPNDHRHDDGRYDAGPIVAGHVRSVIGYAGGSSLLFVLVISVFDRLVSDASAPSPIASVRSKKAEVFYWLTIMLIADAGGRHSVTGPRNTAGFGLREGGALLFCSLPRSRGGSSLRLASLAGRCSSGLRSF